MRSTMSRRTFIESSLAAGAAVAMASVGAVAEPKETVRIGVVGVGNRGTFLTRTLLSLPTVTINAVCDIVPDRATQAQDIVEQARGNRPEAYTKDELDWQNLCARDDLDAVVCATTWEWHTPVMVGAMKAGKYGATEVPACMTLDECWQLVRTSEETGMPCMMLENVCYFQNVLALLRMVREGVFGDMLHCEAGYQHDCRFLSFDDGGALTWRGEYAARLNGNLYPTHPIGPVAQWLGINRGDRFTQLVSMSSAAKGINVRAAEKLGQDHELAKRVFAQGDVNTTLLKTANGCTVTLYYDVHTPRPYDLIFRVQGTQGIYLGTLESIHLAGVTAEGKWDPFAPYLEKYAHPLWARLEAEAVKNGGHGGCDYITLHQFVEAARNGTQTPQDVYDAATWSAIVPLSCDSVAKNSAPVEFPDFTGGKWKTNPPLAIEA